MPHYLCPECNRKYFSTIDSNANCKFCPANWRLTQAGVKPNEIEVFDKTKPKMGTYISPTNPFNPIERYQRPELMPNRRRKKVKASIDEVDIGGALFSRPQRNSVQRLSSDELKNCFDNGQQDLDDHDWEPPARSFNLGMRLTPSNKGRYSCRDPKTVLINPVYTKTKIAQISAPAGRKKTDAVMGAYICKKGTISASKVSGGKKFRCCKDHDEWCHLIGDALGGPTTYDNLVAGSYGANTFMAVLEKLLQGKTSVELTVTAECSIQHVAEFIHFSVCPMSSKSNNYMVTIDAKCYEFTQEDMNSEQTKLEGWMKSAGIPV